MDAFPASQDEVFGALAERADQQAANSDDSRTGPKQTTRAFRAPWKWERLMAESRVVSSSDRWERRLNGSDGGVRLQRDELDTDRARSRRGSDTLSARSTICRRWQPSRCRSCGPCADWPAQARWSDWLDAFEALAPRVLSRPERVLRVLADLRPMGAVGPVVARRSGAGTDQPSQHHRVRAASAPVRPGIRREPGAPARSNVRRRLRSGAGRADVPAESRARIRCCSTPRVTRWAPACRPDRAIRAGEAASAPGRRRRGRAALRLVPDR